MFTNTIISTLEKKIPFFIKQKNTKHLVFFHIPKTGGSSVWHALAKIATLQKIPVIDLYHDAIVKYSNSSKTLEAIGDIQKYLRNHTCLIHHHTEIKIHNYFDASPHCATIVRDPFERFVSHLVYLSTIVRSGRLGKNEVLGGPVEMLRAIADPAIDINSLIDICSRSDYYQNYFRNWFGKLLLGRNGYGGDEQIKDINDPRFPAYVRSSFNNISCFTDLKRALSEIANTFGLPNGNITLDHMLKSSKDHVSENARFKYVSRFEKDYSFLKDIGFSYQK
jgi:hypothetical protein